MIARFMVMLQVMGLLMTGPVGAVLYGDVMSIERSTRGSKIRRGTWGESGIDWHQVILLGTGQSHGRSDSRQSPQTYHDWQGVSQGLTISVTPMGDVIITGQQEKASVPLYIQNIQDSGTITLDHVDGEVMHVMSDRCVIQGKSTIRHLTLEGRDHSQTKGRIHNTGHLVTGGLFVGNMDFKNTGTLRTEGFALQGGKGLITGVFQAQAAHLSQQSALTITGPTAVGWLVVQDNSVVENQGKDHTMTIDHLEGEQGHIINHGRLIIDQGTAYLDRLINTHNGAWTSGDGKIRHFVNSGRWLQTHSRMDTHDGVNTGHMQVQQLSVHTRFNNRNGIIKTARIQGQGECINHGTIQGFESLHMAVAACINHKEMTAKDIICEQGMSLMKNTDEGVITSTGHFVIPSPTLWDQRGSVQARHATWGTLTSQGTIEADTLTIKRLVLGSGSEIHGRNEADLGELTGEPSLIKVGGLLTVRTMGDAFPFLHQWTQSFQAQKVRMQAPSFTNTESANATHYPWPLRLQLTDDFHSSFPIYGKDLHVDCHNAHIHHKVYADGHLTLTWGNQGHVGAKGLVFGKSSVLVKGKALTANSRHDVPGAQAPNIMYTRTDSGLYSHGPITISLQDRFDNDFGTVRGTCIHMDVATLINTAGCIYGTDSTGITRLRCQNIHHVRTPQKSYQTYGCSGHPSMSISKKRRYDHNQLGWCRSLVGCRPQTHLYETSEPGVIASEGDVILEYQTLVMEASHLTAGKSLMLQGVEGEKVAPTTLSRTCLMRGKDKVEGKKLGQAVITGQVRAKTLAMDAARLTVASCSDVKANNQVVRLMDTMDKESVLVQNTPNMYDTALPANRESWPSLMAVVGPGVNDEKNKIPVTATYDLVQQVLGPKMLTLYRGLEGLGLSMNTVMEETAKELQKKKGSQRETVMITNGQGQEQAITVVKNATLTPEDFRESGLPTVLLEFAHQMENQEETLNITTAKQQAADVCLVIPDDTKTRGIQAEKSVTLSGRENLCLQGACVQGERVTLESKQGNVDVLSLTQRKKSHGPSQWQDHSVTATVKAKDHVHIDGHKGVRLKGAHIQSDGHGMITSQGPIVDEALPLKGQTLTQTFTKKSHTQTTTKTLRHQPTRYQVKERLTIHSAQGVYAQASEYQAGHINITAPVVTWDTVNEQTTSHSTTTKTKRRVLGRSSKTTRSVSSSSVSYGGRIDGQTLRAQVETCLRATQMTWNAMTTIRTPAQGHVQFQVGKRTALFTQTSQYKGVLWNKQSTRHQKDVVGYPCRFLRPVFVDSGHVTHETVQSEKHTDNLTVSATTKKDISVHQDRHVSHSQRTKSPSLGVRLILQLATQLMGGSLLPSPSTLMGHMAKAGALSAFTQTGIVALENDGDLSKLGKSATLKTIAGSMISAGIVQGVRELTGLELKSETLGQCLGKAALDGVGDVSVQMGLYHMSLPKALKQSGKMVGVNGISAYGSSRIGRWYSQNPSHYVQHKILHSLWGATTGAALAPIMHVDFQKAMAFGAAGAVTGEILAEMLQPDYETLWIQGQNQGLRDDQIFSHIQEKIQTVSQISQMGAALIPTLLAADTAGISYFAARDAVEHNFAYVAQAAMLAVVISSESVKFYDFYQAEKEKLNVDTGVYSPEAFYRACNIMGERWKSHGENYYQMLVKHLPQLAAAMIEDPRGTSVAVVKGVGQALMNRGKRFVHEWNDSPWKASLSLTADGALMGLEGQTLGLITKPVTQSVKFVVKTSKDYLMTLRLTSKFDLTWDPPWILKVFDRGNAFDTKLGNNMKTSNYPVIDRYIRNADRSINITSIKSRDLSLPTYQIPSKLYYRMKRDMDKLKAFEGVNRWGDQLKGAIIKDRTLCVAIPHNVMTAEQKGILQNLYHYGEKNGVILKIVDGRMKSNEYIDVMKEIL